ncbi:uncharacterized protein BP5553_00151 [Venustampulla echinocandica]|uniref:Uncharacterized protein n=1 Tax=Venustampulla echinocandica TaxID=2656787 RepID=A0A370TXC7_9HELO|nr:uncharacterized protein BP5553_00151 [Venustampulla echinocandica]RDL40172.1 hypothetical protein BP5553_00151 [Venustampulla echinocandica]
MFSSFTRQNLPQQNYTSRDPSSSGNDLETGRQDQSRTFPLRAGGRLKKGIKNPEYDFRHLAKRRDPQLTENLFWYQEFGFRSSNPYWYRFSRGDIFATCLVKLRSTLKHSTSSSGSYLQICIINTSPVPEETLPWLARQLASSLGRLNSILAFPRLAVGIEVEQAWGGLTDCTYKGIEQAGELVKVEQLSLPEFRRQFLSHTFSNCGCKSFRVAQISNYTSKGQVRETNSGINQAQPKHSEARALGIPRFSIELPSKGRQETSSLAKAQLAQCCRIFDRATASFSFSWQRSAPRYTEGFNSFLWEQHSMPPSCSYAEIFYQDDRAFPGPRRVLMTASNNTNSETSFRTTPLLEDLKFFLKTRRPDDPQVWPFMLLLQSNPQTDGYNLLPLFILFEEIISDTAIFLQQVTDEITKLSFAGRNRASTSKVQYLCHADDCRKSALLGVSHAYSILRDLSSIIKKRRRPEQNASPSIIAEFLKEKRADMEFLMEQLEDHLTDRIRAESIQGILCMNVTSPSSIFQSTRASNFIQTPQAASLVATPNNMFANIARQVTVTQTSTLSQPTATLAPEILQLETYTEGLTSATNSLSSTLSSTKPYTFPFIILLISLPILPALSLFVPLTGPSLIRILLQNTHRLRKSLFFKPLVFIAYYLAVFWLVPLTTTKHPNLHIPSLSRTLGAGNNPVSLLSFFVSLTVTTLIFLFNISASIRQRAGASKILIWLLFGIVIAVSYLVDFFSDWLSGVQENVATGLSLEAIAPVLFLIGVWGGGLVRRCVLERERVRGERSEMGKKNVKGKGVPEEVELSRI